MEKNVRGKNTKRKHLSKNKKKSWRKVDINDVEKVLEDERLQERTGGLVAQKKDESLFFVDTKLKSRDKAIESKRVRKRKAQDDLKNVEVTLKPPPPKKKDKRAPAVIEKEASGKLSTKQKTSIQQRKTAKQKRGQKLIDGVKMPVAEFDLWGDTLDKEVKKEDEHYLKVTRKLRQKAPSRLREPVSLIPAVEAPHPGASYNPAYEDYQELLQKAHDREAVRIREEQRIKRALDEKFPTAGEAPNEASNLAEMSAGLYDESESESETEAGDLDNLSVNPPVRRDKKKDERKRKKEKALKGKAKEIQRLKEKRITDNNIYRLRSIKAEVKAHENKLQTRAEKRAAEKAQDLYKTKRLSRQKYEEPEIEMKLSEELVGSLREMRPEGHLLLDRFHSMMKRNMLEPRGRPGKKQKKKYKPKVFEKKSHKEIT